MIQTNNFNYSDFVRELQKEALSSSICVTKQNVSEKIKEKLQKKINKILKKLYQADKKKQKETVPNLGSPGAKSDIGVRRRLDFSPLQLRNKTMNTARASAKRRRFNPNENYEILCLF